MIKNSIWGVVGSFLQTGFSVAYFVIMSRAFGIREFGQFAIAGALYQLVLSVSTMGLGQWFIREERRTPGVPDLAGQFLKLQVALGFVFYGLLLLSSHSLYQEEIYFQLALVLGLNLPIDNLMYGAASFFIAESTQKKGALLTLFDSSLRVLVATSLFVFDWSLTAFCLASFFVRLPTVYMAIRLIGKPIKSVFGTSLSFHNALGLLARNWRFALIAASSVIYWRGAALLASKFLPAEDIAMYEVCYKLFSFGAIGALAVANTIYPGIVSLFTAGDKEGVRSLTQQATRFFTLCSVLGFLIVQCFSSELLTLVFGAKYAAGASCLRLMFCTFLLLPTVLFQAGMLIATGSEKLDLKLNVLSLGALAVFGIGGLSIFPSLAIVNWAVLASFFLFQVFQNYFVIRADLLAVREVIVSNIIILSVFGLSRALEYSSSGRSVLVAMMISAAVVGAVSFFHPVSRFRSQKRVVAPSN